MENVNAELLDCRQEENVKSFGLDFGKAIFFLKQGKRVAREGWNGKGMWLWINKGSANQEFFKPEAIDKIDGVSRSLFDRGDNGTVTRLPNINMHSATGSIVTGWLASQTDMLAEDWCIVD